MQKLTNEELIARYQEEESDSQKKYILDYFFERNAGLAKYMANKFSHPGLEKEDFISLANYGMLKAFNTFDPTKGYKFTTYAARIMHNAILMELRLKEFKKTTISIDAPIHTDKDGNELTVEALLCLPDNEVEEAIENKLIIQEIIKASATILSGREKEVFQNFLSKQPLSQAQLAAQLNLSQSYVCRLEQSCIRKLKNYFEENEIPAVNQASHSKGSTTMKITTTERTTMGHTATENTQQAAKTEELLVASNMSPSNEVETAVEVEVEAKADAETEVDTAAETAVEEEQKEPIAIAGETLRERVFKALTQYPEKSIEELSELLQAPKTSIRTYSSQFNHYMRENNNQNQTPTQSKDANVVTQAQFADLKDEFARLQGVVKETISQIEVVAQQREQAVTELEEAKKRIAQVDALNHALMMEILALRNGNLQAV